MKKKILFVIPEYSFGGTNKSLQNLISFLSKDEYNINVLSLYEDGGKYYKDIFRPYIIKKGIIYYLLHDNVITRKILGLYMKINPKDKLHWLYKYEAKRIEKQYNFCVVVAYQELLSTEFVSYFDNSKKIAWIQCDYPALVGKNRYDEDKAYYSKFEKIVCVSEGAAFSLRGYFPEYNDKIVSIYNLLDTKFIIEQSNKFIPDYNRNVFNIVSVGRLNLVKGFDNIPQIVSKLKEMISKPIVWYIIGDGEERMNIQKLISNFDVCKEVVLLGLKDNPYPFIKNADLYVCTSKTESYSYTIAESKILHTPILTTDFPVAKEVLNSKLGWICNLCDMPSVLYEIISDKDKMYSVVKSNLTSYKFDNSYLLKKIDSLFA